MVVAAPEARFDLRRAVGEQRVVFREITWQGYLQILAALPECRNSRITYDEGVLEITVPLEEHEFSADNISYFILTLVELMGLRLKSMGSTTMKYPGLNKGAEPDKAFYIQNHALVKGRDVDFTQDPPPDLVVEVDITHTDIQKNQFYSRLGVPEFWRFDGKCLKIYQLQDTDYVEVDRSPTFPQMPKEWLYDFLNQAKDDEIGAVQALRECFREQIS
ncbi:MAG: Uma2 family endonuclease [Alkalinema sp. RU_4_3]|nr:Uma2 family endonuclease [Alkalinema sp. RU_4_3]